MEIQTLRGEGYECNSYLIKDREWVLVDVGTPRNMKRLIGFVEQQGGLEKVKRIVLTHTHYDHAGGASQVSDLLGAELLVHPLEGNRIADGDFSVALTDLFGEKMTQFEWSPIKEGFRIDTGTASFKVLHLPGHSEGSIALWEEASGSLMSGDTVFADGGIGRYDLPTGSLQELEKSIKRVSSMHAKNLYPGHGREVLREGAEHIEMSYRAVAGGV